MPEMGYETRTTNDKSALTEGWHPAFLLAITDEATPPEWKMFAQSPRMWRWHVAVWESTAAIRSVMPEHQSVPSSQKFSPGGKFQASKAYEWTCELLGRKISAGERVNLDPLMPLPCRVKIKRNEDYANISDLERWTEGAQYVTPEFRAQLAAFLAAPPAEPAAPPVQTPASQPPPAQPPGMQSWGSPATQPTLPGTPPPVAKW